MTFAVRVADAELTVDGPTRRRCRVLAGSDTAERGIWQITPGTVTDVEADEMFVAIAIEGGPVFDVGPGDVCVLTKGDRTTWTVHETLRKVCQITSGR